MPLPTLITWLTADDYDAVKRLAPNDADLPETYSEWLKLQSDSISNFEKYGRAYKKVTIHSDGLAQYCEASGMHMAARTNLVGDIFNLENIRVWSRIRNERTHASKSNDISLVR